MADTRTPPRAGDEMKDAELRKLAEAAPDDFGGPDPETWAFIEKMSPRQALALLDRIAALRAALMAYRGVATWRGGEVADAAIAADDAKQE